MTDLPLPRDLEAPVGELVLELAGHLGERATVDLCVELLEGADRNDHPDAMPYLTGVVFDETSPKFYPSQWKDYWVRTWGARGLLYVWHDSAATAVVAGLDDEHWRPAEMCLKVSTKRELGEAGPRAAVLAVEGELPRVRVQALRTLGAVGDTEHVDVVRSLLEDEEAQVRRQAARSLSQLARRLDLDVALD
ncbi:HEAT repeat domain-containing protein [Nocardioides islandensis]|uniref:HEAT repeat domain-containing protein n=1 Tax=Nocardioides islandensis TaxID=433663 RepID=A0A930YEN5_9ACTN|nr:HEAT repeat domain-containing protein [Nocardioides islandensis]MBF4765596.1 HEAT repeat domain-containing protein [Nocardioides islandensis]